jgi:class 3 adenylate cyclase/tetratricopeptide (TPR) repeat protein
VAGTKFCAECGTQLAAGCPSCGTQNAPGAKFCVECGTNLLGPGPPAPTPAPAAEPAAGSAERRLVSVLFADLVGSTTLAEDRDPEESRDLLSRYFDIASELIGRYGGTVEKFIGDAVMAVWGVPTAHEDDAERAVRAALDLVTAVGGMTDAGQSLQLRAAVLTGEAAATIGASGQGMVAGDLVNTASRLQGAAPPGTVLVGESTYRATSGAIGYEEAGEQLLKGKAAPVAAWRAVRVIGMRGGAGRRAALEPPFVGRDDELQLLKDLFHATVRERKPRLVTVVGQAGIGKSRLGWEFEKYIDGVTLTAYWHAGRSPSYGEGISFWALAEMIRERSGIAETDDSDTARAKLAATAVEWLTDAEERRWVEPRLAGLLGLEDMPAGQREELFAAWRTFFERIADRDPVILVFKDLHWADTALLEFVEHVLAWSREHPIYVVAMTRPELFERYPAWGGATVKNATTLTLEPLADKPMRELLHGLVPGLPEDAVSTITQRADGVPLYAVETVRMLIDRGQLVPEGDGYALAGPIDRLAVPETLQALVAARIDANDPADRAILADAAVVGQSFTMPALAGITGQDETALGAALDRLVRRELLIRDDDPRSPERGQYRFVQAIVREIAYETLSKKDRRAKHLAAARHFEALGDEELAGVLASHYLEALRETPAGPEADALAAQARIALRAAAERATALHAHAVAFRHLQDAIEITSDPAEQVALNVACAVSADAIANPDAFAYALRAAAVAKDLGDREAVIRATTMAGKQHTNRGRGAEALAVLEPLVAELSEDEPGAAAAFAELARVYMLTDRNPEAVEVADKALRAAGRLRETEVIVEALATRGPALADSGRVDEAEATMRGAVVLADRNGHYWSALRARNNLMSTLGFDLRSTDLLALQTEGLDLARPFGFQGWMAQFLFQRFLVLIQLGDWAAAEADLTEFAELGGFRGYVLPLQGEMLALQGDPAASRAAMNEVDAHMRTVDTAPQVTSVDIEVTRSLLILGDAAGALRRVRASPWGGSNDILLASMGGFAAAELGERASVEEMAAKVKAALSLGLPRAVAHQLAAAGSAAGGQWDDAHLAYRQAIAGFRALERYLDTALLGLEYAAYLGTRFEEARAAGEEASVWFSERGAGHVADGYRAAFKGTPAPPATRTGVGGKAVPVDAEQPA